MSQNAIVVLMLLALSNSARADRGAVSLEAGAGGTLAFLRSPAPPGFVILTPVTTPATSAVVLGGARYAISDNLEVSLAGFFEPTVLVGYAGVTLRRPASDTEPTSDFPGTLNHRYQAYGASLGGRWVWGHEWRFHVGAELGWTRRAYSGFVHYDVHLPSSPTDYQLPLPNLALDFLTVSLGGGVQWDFTDKMGLSFAPRVQLLAGRELSIAVLGALVFSYSWYI